MSTPKALLMIAQASALVIGLFPLKVPSLYPLINPLLIEILTYSSYHFLETSLNCSPSLTNFIHENILPLLVKIRYKYSRKIGQK